MISINNVTKSYRHHVVFDDITVLINEPGIYGLVAPNGYGKTTLFNLISGISRVNKGEIRIDSQKTHHVDPKSFSYLQSNDSLYPYLSGYDHLKFLCDIHNIAYHEIKTISAVFQMEDYLKNKTKSYSLGMKQRLLLAMAMIKQPHYLLLDEPLTGLDPTSTVIVRDNIKKISDQGATVLISSHDLNELDKLTKTIFFIENKKVILEKIETHESSEMLYKEKYL